MLVDSKYIELFSKFDELSVIDKKSAFKFLEDEIQLEECDILLAHAVNRKIELFQEIKFLRMIVQMWGWKALIALDFINNPQIVDSVVKNIAKELKRELPSAELCRILPTTGIIASKLRSYMKLTPKELRKLLVSNKRYELDEY